MVDDKPYHQRNEHDPHEREAVGDIHLTFLPAADCAPFRLADLQLQILTDSTTGARPSGLTALTGTEDEVSILFAELEAILSKLCLQLAERASVIEGNGGSPR